VEQENKTAAVQRYLDDLARRLDEQPGAVGLSGLVVSAPASSSSGISPEVRRMVDAIESLPETVP
jgi:RNA polymerase sigma-70 factor (ECF subfamily)